MIAKLSGILDSASRDSLILDVQGVGYLVQCSSRTLSRAGQPGDTLSLYIETQVREDAFNLFGFLDPAEQEWFRLLVSVQGVGAKAGMAILSVSPPDKLGFAIAAGDKTALTQAEGVGPKLATRILTELKDKASKMDLSPQPAASKDAPVSYKELSTKESTETSTEAVDNAAVDHDAVSALVNLGYGRSDAYSAVMQARQKVMAKANDNEFVAPADLQVLIRLALKELA